MQLFKRKKKIEKPQENTPVIPEKTYAQWKQEYNQLEIENAELEDECAREGLDWVVMLQKTAETKKRMAYVDKMMRKLQEPSLVYNKKWKGKKIVLNEFMAAAIAKEIVDTDGEGYYATETAKTDIIVRPSDIIENIYRDDFPYVIWFQNNKE